MNDTSINQLLSRNEENMYAFFLYLFLYDMSKIFFEFS